jgi:hypothetical protein
MGFLNQRYQVSKEIAWTPIVWTVGAIFGLMSGLAFFRDEFLPEAYRENLRILKLIPRWNWRTWAIAGLTAIIVLILEGAYRAVTTRQERVRELEEMLIPKLEIVFDPEMKPYFEEQPIRAVPSGVLGDRRYRVGIRNKSSEVVRDAQVVLEGCTPGDMTGVHPGHALQVMGEERGSGKFNAAPGDDPTAFVDVIYEETMDGRPWGNAFGLCYAASISFAIPRASYILTLRLEGAETPCRKRFSVDKDPHIGKLTMRELVAPSAAKPSSL